MSKYCLMCNAVTNCTDNCNSCLKEQEREEECLPRTYAEPEYTSEQLENDPIAIEGTRWDDLNYQHYRER